MTTYIGRRFVVGTCFATAITLALVTGMTPSRGKSRCRRFSSSATKCSTASNPSAAARRSSSAGKPSTFSDEADEAGCFEPAAGRITLIDVKRRVRSELSLEQLSEFIERMRDRALRGGSDFGPHSSLSRNSASGLMPNRTSLCCRARCGVTCEHDGAAERRRAAQLSNLHSLAGSAQLRGQRRGHAAAGPHETQRRTRRAAAPAERVTMKRPANIRRRQDTAGRAFYTWRLEMPSVVAWPISSNGSRHFGSYRSGEYLTPTTDR